jgi:hypothetical protein
MKWENTILWAFFFTLVFYEAKPLCAQTTTVEGYLTEKGTNEPIGYALVRFKNTEVGGLSDLNGYYKLTIENAKLKDDSLVVSLISYKTKTLGFVRGQKQKLNIVLESAFLEMGEIVIESEERVAWRIMEKVIAEKKKNNPLNKQNYRCEEYSKTRFDLNHFTEKIKDNILFRPFDFMWDNVDTTEDGVPYLPILLVEKVIDHHYQFSPPKKTEVVVAEKKKGFAGPKITQFVQDLYLMPNIYEDYVVLLDKNFPSPIGSNYRDHYSVYLIDSTTDALGKNYRIDFKPKRQRELGFTGAMVIDSGSYALRSISLKFDIMANVNFVRSYLINQKYEKVTASDWMLTESNVLGDFTVIENLSDLTGFFGHKNATFRHYSINQAKQSSTPNDDDVVSERNGMASEEHRFWEKNRPTALSEKEQKVYGMVDSLEKHPKFILRKNILEGIATGYVPWKKRLEIGDLYTFYSYNKVEHSRFKLGLRLPEKSSSPFKASGYGAYGTFDEKWKYGLSTSYHVKKSNTTLGFQHQYDIEQLGISFTQLPIDHILTSLVQIGDDASRNYVTKWNVYADQTWAKGFVTRLSYFDRSIQRTFGQDFLELSQAGNTIPQTQYHTSGIGMTAKFSLGNTQLNGAFYDKKDTKNSFKTLPDLAFDWQYADKSAFNSDLHFHKLKMGLQQQVRLRKYGYTKYYLELGKTIGQVPYPFLDLPFANQLVLYNEYAFNLMHYLEYAADQYLLVILQHHFDGYILDKIPLVNRLKWRSLVFAKGYFGQLSAENNKTKYLFPTKLNQLNEPYYEVGFGLENIFKIARMDFVWRLTDTDKPDVYYFIVKPSFRFAF